MFDVTREALSRHTTLRLGGPASHLVTATDRDEIVEMVRRAGDRLLILAGGSNVVVPDEGFFGTVVLLRSRGTRLTPVGADRVHLTVEAGHPWDEVVALAVAEGLAGIEALAGIPGSAGATPIQNVGAYGQEVADTVVSVDVYDRADDSVRTLPAAECGFGYRTSRFKHRDRRVILAVTYELRRAAVSGPLRYAELARALGATDGVALADIRAAVLALRAAKGMVLDPDDPDTYSVGSFFTNPVLDAVAFADLRDRAIEVVGAEPTGWPGPDGTTKVSAAWLIERAGFTKGFHGGHPGVAVSGKHSLALTNRGIGTTAALLALARDIRDGVRKTFDVELHPEPVLVNREL